MDENQFNPSRLLLARKRRRFTAKALAEAVGVSAITISRLENGHNCPDAETVSGLAAALSYPVEFFQGEDLDELLPRAASFRSLSSMTARERDAALAAGSIAFVLADWVSERYNLPTPDLPNLRHSESPAVAAEFLRQHWRLGEKPVGNMVQLLESKGIRVFSLAENTLTVDAYSCWRNETPYVFLNTRKSAEHSRFDAAHELGHLVLHRHGEVAGGGRGVEEEANQFASAFLMPRRDVLAHASRVSALPAIIRAKRRWGVSVAALTVRLHQTNLISQWRYAELFRQMSKAGYRSAEPDGLPREVSKIWPIVLADLWKDRITLDRIARDLSLPVDELRSLLTNLVQPSGGATEYSEGKGVRDKPLWVVR